MRKIILLDYGYEKIEALCDFIVSQGCEVDIVSHEVESGDNRPFGAIEYPEKKLYGIQYVLDVEGSETDKQAIRHFLLL